MFKTYFTTYHLKNFISTKLILRLEGFERGMITNTGAVSVDTGIFTGRSPKDKYIVKEPGSEKNIWWKVTGKKSSDNKMLSEENWDIPATD